MYDSLRCLFFSASITLFANVPELFEWQVEKIGFGALLFFIIWTYMKHILPNTHAEMERKDKINAELVDEIRHLNAMRDKDHETIEKLLKENRQNPRSMEKCDDCKNESKG